MIAGHVDGWPVLAPPRCRPLSVRPAKTSTVSGDDASEQKAANQADKRENEDRTNPSPKLPPPCAWAYDSGLMSFAAHGIA